VEVRVEATTSLTVAGSAFDGVLGVEAGDLEAAEPILFFRCAKEGLLSSVLALFVPFDAPWNLLNFSSCDSVVLLRFTLGLLSSAVGFGLSVCCSFFQLLDNFATSTCAISFC